MKLERYNVTVIIEDPDEPAKVTIKGGTKIAVTLERVKRDVILNDPRMHRYIGNLLVQFEQSVTDNPSMEVAIKLADEVKKLKKENS